MSAKPTAPAAVDAKTADPSTPKKGGKKKLLLALPILLIAVGAAGWFSGVIPKMLGHEAEGAHAASVVMPPSFFDLPDIVANLNTGTRRAAFIKLKAKLELARAEDQPGVQAALPRILDLFQGYLREMRPDELRGTASTCRLREELLARTNLAVAPARVTAVLFTEMIVQ